MANPKGTSQSTSEQFPLPFFILTILATATGLVAALKLLVPEVLDVQFAAPWWKNAIVFLSVSLAICFGEYFFHRFVRHTLAIPFLRFFYRKPKLHRVDLHRSDDGKGILISHVDSSEVERNEADASAFPWYSFAVFGLVWAPLLALLQWLIPTFPWFSGGFVALGVSLSLYEILHAIHQWPFAKWEPLIKHPRWGGFWRPIYAFHLRHHAKPNCNESLSGFLGFPLADWVFGTCVIPKTSYGKSELWAPTDLREPRPVGLIRWFDNWARRRSECSIRRSEVSIPKVKAVRAYTPGEEVANWVTHGIGLILSIVGLALLVGFAVRRGDLWHLVSFTVFGITLLILYAASTFYHMHREERGKLLFRKLDHAAIFLLIAGTYTPFLLTELRGPWGWTLFAVIWTLCGTGAIIQLFLYGRYPLASTLAYLFAGWLIVVALKPLIENVPQGGLWLLVAGGLSYTVGVVFFLWHRLRYHHAVWHLFVLGGSTCHFLAVLLFLLPGAGEARS